MIYGLGQCISTTGDDAMRHRQLQGTVQYIMCSRGLGSGTLLEVNVVNVSLQEEWRIKSGAMFIKDRRG